MTQIIMSAVHVEKTLVSNGVTRDSTDNQQLSSEVGQRLMQRPYRRQAPVQLQQERGTSFDEGEQSQSLRHELSSAIMSRNQSDAQPTNANSNELDVRHYRSRRDNSRKTRWNSKPDDDDLPLASKEIRSQLFHHPGVRDFRQLAYTDHRIRFQLNAVDNRRLQHRSLSSKQEKKSQKTLTDVHPQTKFVQTNPEKEDAAKKTEIKRCRRCSKWKVRRRGNIMVGTSTTINIPIDCRRIAADIFIGAQPLDEVAVTSKLQTSPGRRKPTTLNSRSFLRFLS